MAYREGAPTGFSFRRKEGFPMKRSARVCVFACSLVLAIGRIGYPPTALSASKGRPGKPPGEELG